MKQNNNKKISRKKEQKEVSKKEFITALKKLEIVARESGIL